MADSINLELDTVRVLIDRIRTGDSSAQSELVNQIQSYVSLMADKNLDQDVRNCVGPSDVVQQTMIIMVRGIDGFQGKSTREFFGWLNKIIKNEALKIRRDLTRQKRDLRRQKSLGAVVGDSRMSFEPEEEHLTPQSNAIATERVELFHLALSRLSDDYTMVIRLRNLQQLSFPEIAEKMNRTKDSVTKLWCRAVIKFKQELEALDDDSRQR